MPVQRFIRSDPNLQEGCVRLVIVVRHPAFRRVPLQIPFSPVPVAPAVAPILLHYLVGELFPPLLVMLVNRFSLLSGEVAEVQPIPAGALGPAEVVKPVMLKGRVTSSVVDRRLRLPSPRSPFERVARSRLHVVDHCNSEWLFKGVPDNVLYFGPLRLWKNPIRHRHGLLLTAV